MEEIGRIGFDNELYMNLQYENIVKRIKKYNNKLYLEFGGKLFDDYHAMRVLPGFDPNVKTKLLLKFKDDAEIIFAVNAADLEKNKVRGDTGLGYGDDTIRLIKSLRNVGLFVSAIVITLYDGQPAADRYKAKLEMLGERVYVHRKTEGYPNQVEKIVSDEGYGKNPYIETTRPLVIVTAPGGGSGKLATCLGQLYHEYKRGVSAGYAKFETFPIWNLPLKHPVNLAYEAATIDLKDKNEIDHYHLDAYNVVTVNYNRDIEVFPIVKNILEKIQGTCDYRSPTDMGVNMAGYAIIDDNIVREAAKQEIIRRYYRALLDKKIGLLKDEAIEKLQRLLTELNLSEKDRPCIDVALQRAKEKGSNVLAVQLKNGRIVTGRSSKDMTATSSCLLNCLKILCGISDDKKLISKATLNPILELKKQYLNSVDERLSANEVLIALSISATTNPFAEEAFSTLSQLKGTEAHSTCMLTENDASILRKLGVNVTSEPVPEII